MSKAEALAEEMLRLADLSDAGRGPAKSDPRRQAAAELRRLAALEKAISDAEPVAHLWQHGETGRTRIVMPDQIVTADANWSVVGPLYTLNGIKKP